MEDIIERLDKLNNRIDYGDITTDKIIDTLTSIKDDIEQLHNELNEL